MFRLLMFSLALLLCLASVGQAANLDQTDEELAARIVGEWFAQDKNGSTTYTFNADGTWTETGVYYFKEGSRDVTVRGRWYVHNGFFYHSIIDSNVPGKIKTGKFEKIKIKYVTDDEFFLKLRPGKHHPHLDLD